MGKQDGEDMPTCETCGCPLAVFLTPQEVSEALRVSRRTVYNLCRRGELDGRRVTDQPRWRIYHTSVHDYLGKDGPDPDWWVEWQCENAGL